MIKKELQQLLQEIYTTNPDLKKDEEKIIDILENIGALKPKVILDEKLKQQIKQEILNKINNQNHDFSYTQNHTPKLSLLNRFVYSIAGMAVALAILIPLYTLNNTSQIEQTLVSTTIEQLEQEAFFSKGFESDQNTNSRSNINIKSRNIENDGTQIESINTLPQADYALDENEGDYGYEESTKAGFSAMAQPKIIANTTSLESKSMDIMPINDYIPTIQTYTFKGELPSLKDQMNVYKILENKDIFNNLSKNIKTKGLDLQKFKNLKIDNISFSQDQENGYHIYIDNKGNININRNDEFNLRGEDNQNKKLDKKLAINNSNKFIKEYKLDLSQYGDPIVTQDHLDIMYAMDGQEDLETYTQEDGQENTSVSSYKSMIYPSNNINISYPYMIDKYLVYEQYGMDLYGVKFRLNTSNYKVASIYNLQNHKLQSSKYNIEQDINTLLNQVNNRGYEPEFYKKEYGEKVKNIEIELINPEVQYMKHYTYTNGQSHEFFVPVLIFSQKHDKTKTKQDYEYEYDYYAKNQKIIIPIVEDFDTKFGNNDNHILYR